MVWFEDQPGVVQMIYFDASDGGASCTIGVQGNQISIIHRDDGSYLYFV